VESGVVLGIVIGVAVTVALATWLVLAALGITVAGIAPASPVPG
jgi:hypothetical protein